MRRLAIVLGAVAIVAVGVFLLIRRERPVRLEPEPQGKLASTTTPESTERVSRSMTVPEPHPRKLTLPASAEENLNQQGQQIMREALRTFQSLELERRQFPSNSFGEVILHGLQRKLFLDDYTYAKVLSDADCSEAEKVYNDLLEQIGTIDRQTLAEGGL